MEFYFISIIIILTLSIISNVYDDTHSKRVFFISSSVIYIALFSGLRDVSVGSDTLAYLGWFDRAHAYSWAELLDLIISNFLGSIDVKAPGYVLLEKVFQITFPSYQLFLLFIGFLFTYQIGRFIQQESSYPLISFVIYLCLFFEFFGITGHRQTIATAISILMGYRYIVERRFWPYLLLVLIASTLHKSALILLPFYFIARFPYTRRFSLVILVGFIVAFALKSQFFNIALTLGGYEQYSEFESRGAVFFSIIYISLVCCYFYLYPLIIKNRPTADITLNALWFGAIFLPLVFVNPSVMRIVQYFSIFLLLAVPDMIKCVNEENRTLVYFSSVALLVLLLLRKNYHYQLMIF